VAVAVVALVTVKLAVVPQPRTLQSHPQQQMVQTGSAAVAVEVVPVVQVLLAVSLAFKRLAVEVVELAFAGSAVPPDHRLQRLEQ
jgi:hypothetical protein